MRHVWNEHYRALYDRTYRVLCDAGIDEQLADELATQRTLLTSREQLFPGFVNRPAPLPAATRHTARPPQLVEQLLYEQFPVEDA
jgi:hypothetical protein